MQTWLQWGKEQIILCPQLYVFYQKARAAYNGDKEGYLYVTNCDIKTLSLIISQTRKKLTDKEREEVLAEKNKESLFACVQKWLESFPELNEKNFNFPAKYEQAVLAMVKPFEDRNKQDGNEEGMKAIEMVITTLLYMLG